MSERDSFAMAAINGLLSDPGVAWYDEKTGMFDEKAIRLNSELAWRIADAMIVAKYEDKARREVCYAECCKPKNKGEVGT